MPTDVPVDVPAELVHYAVVGEVATITLDSPRNRNALSRQLVAELGQHLAAVDADDAVTVVVLRAEGRVFCSGADLVEAASGSMETGAQGLIDLLRQIVVLAKPVVCRLQGPVRAGGIGIVAACDVAVASDQATFALTEVKLGLAPAVISLTVLPRMTSRAAAWACLGGEVFSGAEAAEHGLVTCVVPAEALDTEIESRCAALATGAPQGLRETKRLLNRELVAGIDAHRDELAAQSARLFGSEEAREAMTAFLARGEPSRSWPQKR